MPLPSQIHRDAALENLSVAFKTEGLIADALSPMFPVKHETDEFYVYSRDTLSLPQTFRANGGESNRATWSLSVSTYQLTEHALHDLITDRDRGNADAAVKLDADTTEYLTEKILMRKEVDLADLVSGNNWANVTSLTSTFAWSANTSLSNPIAVVDSATAVILQNSGKRPNVIQMDYRSFLAAKEHTSLTDRIKYTSADSVGPDLMARLFNLDKVLVASGIQNTAEENLADSMAFIWTDGAFVAYIDPSPGLKKVTALNTFVKSEGGIPYEVRRWREDRRKADAIEVSCLFQHRSIASACGYAIRDTIQ